MLTKTDLSQIRKVVREETEAESRDFQREMTAEMKLLRMGIEVRLSKLEDKVKNLDVRTESHFNKIEKELRRIKKDISTMINFFNKEDVSLSKRVVHIEEHLGLTSVQ